MKHIYKTMLLTAAGALLTAGAAAAWTLTQAYTYHGATGQPVSVAWQPDPGAERYELQLLHEDHHRVAQALETDATEGTLTPPRSGRYRVRVRSIAPAGTRSNWYFSTDAGAARVAGQPMGWQLFAWLAPASSPELE